ncbi:ArsR/SmtB family transcription factor [Adhaeribacter radiodurans]|uniref:Winged helix-turn-helix transcriptional regulator n=1 Tax=Adhaeribacter radiodurans TaxID=2745197 RepID=A0A7L7L2F6_9BACT|nr:metalloregulator ArsR/SmtB family transcription factor [Adhaeribacter radiodurans]QMU26943.1 winged helix-turn-helix transcriptional regulator [Adhaeribacter radiodurans]
MGVTKTQNFTEAQNQLATYAKAIAHPARVAILQYLLKQQTCICSNLVEKLPLAQATISQHLKELKAVGLIKGEIEGTSVCYCINEPVWEQAKDMLLNLFTLPVASKNCC